MKQTFEDLMYQAGLTAQGCWDEMDDYDRQAIEKFAELIVQDCLAQCRKNIAGAVGTYPGAYNTGIKYCIDSISKHFGVER